MKKLYLAILFLINFSTLSTQTLQWANQGGSSSSDSANDIVIDEFGNTYVTGSYFDNADFGNGNILPSAGSSDIFVAKYNSSGTLIGINRFGGSYYDDAYGITLDNSGNIILTGLLNNFEGVNILIVKFDPAFNVVWSVTELVTEFIGSGNSVGTDNAGNVYITGAFEGTAYFNDGASSTIALTSTTPFAPDIFVAKYNSSGQLQWAVSEGGTFDDYGIGIAVTSSGIFYVSGWFKDSALGLNSAGEADAFLAKFSASGSLLWAKREGSSQHDEAVDVALDDSGNVLITGSKQSIGFSAFNSKYNSNGSLLWTTNLPDKQSHSIFYDKNDSYYITGLTDSSTDSDFFVAKFTNQNNISSAVFGGSDIEVGEGIAVDVGENIYIAGRFHGTFTSAGITLNSAGQSDAFIGKLSPGLYCSSSPVLSENGYISEVKLNNQPNTTSTCGTYSDFTNITIGEVYPGMTVYFNVTLASCSGNFDKGAKIFIDWNRDLDFTDTGEEVFVSSTVGNGNLQGSFLVPANLDVGPDLTMRVVCMNIIPSQPDQDDPTDIQPCGIYFYGETEDYSIQTVNYQEPLISNFSPSSGYIGNATLLNGNFFDPNSIEDIQFGGQNGIYAIIDNNTIIAVPDIGSVSGPITIVTNTGSVNSSANYTLLCAVELGEFETPNLPGGWIGYNPDNQTTLQIINTGGYGNSSQSLYMDNYNYNAPNQLDGLFVANICLQNVTNLNLEIDFAYTYFLDGNIIGTDSLLIVNIDNGEVLWIEGGMDLATAPPQSSAFLPSSTEWESINIDLSSVLQANVDEVNIAILNKNGYGNNLYLDNINFIFNNPPLPIELGKFIVHTESCAATIEWTTLTEVNVDYFQVEKSTNGYQFEPIGNVPASGNSLEELNYSFMDEDLGQGEFYYRLTIIDLDQSISFSQVISLYIDCYRKTQLNIFPNPSDGLISIFNDEQDDLVAILYDAIGRVHLKKVIIPSGNSEHDFSLLPSGRYLLVYYINGTVKEHRIFID